MQLAALAALPSRLSRSYLTLNSNLPNHPAFAARAARFALGVALLLALACACTGQAWATASLAPTTTTLSATSNTINAQEVVVLVATVTGPASSAVGAGQVNFYDGKALLGTAQVVTTGTKFTHGTAHLSMQLPYGTHVLKAVFAGNLSYAASTSSTRSFTVGGGVTQTTFSTTGSNGTYTATSQVTGNSVIAPTGAVSFIDQTNSNLVLSTANLGSNAIVNTFAQAVAYPIYKLASNPADSKYPYQAVVADFNGDGFEDIAEVDYTARISVHLGNGNGTFQATAPFCFTGSGTSLKPCKAGSEPQGLAVADFNSDGIPDLATIDGNNVGIALGNGDGTFQTPVYFSDGASSFPSFVVADFNHDGIPDVAVTNLGGIGVLLGNGDGTFKTRVDIRLNPSGQHSGELIAVGDFNHDGIPDLVTANGSYLMAVLGKGDGTFGPEKDSPVKLNPSGGSIVTMDFKKTGYLTDLAMAGSEKLETYTGNGDGTFTLGQTIYPGAGIPQGVAGMLAADLNEDGIVDIALCYYHNTTTPGTVGIYAGKSDGTLNTTPTTLTVGLEPLSVALGFFDGTGAPELVTANYKDDTVSVLLDSATATSTATTANEVVPGLGTHNLIATYPGDAAFSGSQSPVLARAGNQVPPPTITSLSPVSAPAGGAPFSLVVKGTGFDGTTVVYWNGSARTTLDNSATQVTAQIATADISKVGTDSVTVRSDRQYSAATSFTVKTAPVPAITTLSPSTAIAGNGAFTLTVNGSGFDTGATVLWNGSSRATTLVSATKLTAAITAADIAKTGTATVAVVSDSQTTKTVNFAITSK